MQIGGTFLEMMRRLIRPSGRARGGAVRSVVGLCPPVAGDQRRRCWVSGGRARHRADRGDRRFKDAAWNDNVLFDFIEQSYLLAARFLLDRAHEAGRPTTSRDSEQFYTRQFVGCAGTLEFRRDQSRGAAPHLETRGENLLRGLRNMLEDLERGKGRLAIKMTDLEAFGSAGTSPTRPARSSTRMT